MNLRHGTCAIFSILTTVLVAGCGPTSFSSKGASNAPTTPPAPTQGGLPETQSGAAPSIPAANTLPSNQSICSNGYRALRIAFVVDNSGSNDCSPGVVQTGNMVCGTDALKDGDPRGRYTDRQRAVYQAILRIIELDKDAVAHNASFPGSAVGLAYFPVGASLEQMVAKTVSGQTSVLPQVMTSTKDLAPTESFKNALWDTLKFTQSPAGLTPYGAALEAARNMLTSTKSSSDPRPDLVVFITDGLPTDEMPSKVRQIRQSFASTPLIILSVFQKGNDIQAQNKPAHDTIEKAFYDDRKWGSKPGASDGFSSFDQYWQTLIDLPKQISSQIVEVNGSENLQATVDKILAVFQTCSSK